MAKKIYEEENIRGIATAIREKTSTDKTYKISDMPEGVNEVYEAGQLSEYDKFWDNYQTNGNRRNYYNAFYGSGWNNETFKPKYNIQPTNSYMMFANSQISGDLVEILSNLGITFDLSKNTNTVAHTFANTQFTRIGIVSCISVAQATNLFQNSKQLTTVDKLILKPEGTQPLDNSFLNCTTLENITIEGVIGRNISLAHSPLTAASITNIINVLSDTAEEMTATFNLSAVNNAFETSKGAEDGSTSEEWLTLVSSKPNWKIELV